MSPLRDSLDPLPPLFACSHDDIAFESAGLEEQEAFCTRDQDCAAAADGHYEDCPVEKRLLKELGF